MKVLIRTRVWSPIAFIKFFSMCSGPSIHTKFLNSSGNIQMLPEGINRLICCYDYWLAWVSVFNDGFYHVCSMAHSNWSCSWFCNKWQKMATCLKYCFPSSGKICWKAHLIFEVFRFSRQFLQPFLGVCRCRSIQEERIWINVRGNCWFWFFWNCWLKICVWYWKFALFSSFRIVCVNSEWR